MFETHFVSGKHKGENNCLSTGGLRVEDQHLGAIEAHTEIEEGFRQRQAGV